MSDDDGGGDDYGGSGGGGGGGGDDGGGGGGGDETTTTMMMTTTIPHAIQQLAPPGTVRFVQTIVFARAGKKSQTIHSLPAPKQTKQK